MIIEIFLFLALFLFMITYLIHAELYFRKLQKSCPDMYTELGSPSVLGKKQSALPIIQFFASGQYRQLEDRRLARRGDWLILHFFVVLITFISFFGYLFATGKFA